MKSNKENQIKTGLYLLSMIFLVYIGSTLFNRAKLDFTSENIYTLSNGTKSILSKLDSPIKLKLYYSKTAANKGTEGLRAFNNHFFYVKDLLREFAGNSRNNLTLEIIDPRPDTAEEEDALTYGLKKFQLTDTEKYFFGLVAESESGGEKVIEFFDPGEKDKLEYNVSKLIYTVLHPQKKTVGVISPLEVVSEDMSPYMAQIMQMQGKPVKESWVSLKLLKEFYEVKKIEMEVESISGLEALVVIHPKGFPEKTLYAIDQFLLKGGKLLVFADPNAISDQAGRMTGGSASPDAGFSKLMAKWGFSMAANTYAGDKTLSGVGRFNPNMPPSRLLPILNCDQTCTSEYKDTVSSGVKQAVFVYPGAVTATKIEGVEHSAILSTSPKGNTYTAQGHELNNPPMLWQKFQDGDKPVVLAYKAFGKFKSAYPEGFVGKEKKKESKDSPVEHLSESAKDAAVIIFADVDFIHDQFAFKRSFLGLAAANDNSSLLLNSVEALSGDVDLMAVRSKGRVNRTFDVIDDIERRAEKKTEEKVKQINGSIARFQSELNQLGRQANEGNIALLQTEGLRKKKELAKTIAGLKKELRNVKREGREKVESIGKLFQYVNTLLVPLIIIIGGVWYSRRRSRLLLKSKKSEAPQNTGGGRLKPVGGEA